ncbi:RNA polymerase sigma factor SigJ [Nocardia stercoris]|uniref:Sigma-70 family RNA polymerase sigma factor n=1 Tax=Nocardia stercoris TaxID=2483361 RepID=A0A3M2KTL9_9NOCA|nr:RNA polymerase sigma factor SigJ [Nocardia stercoris]RMI28992.1 sigma-70 family RNA polymerase sigma factor [Nocardia stercoris]
MTLTDAHTERFTLLRPLLFTIAYEILGSATESDDVLQDSYLRWSRVDLATVRDTKSYLAQLVTRQALDALRAGARRREDYTGPWLPEPLLITDQDASTDVLLAESVSMGMLVLLETLGPDERAVFVLREVFGFEYDEIAAAVGKSSNAVRQMAYRARAHVQARRSRFGPVDPARTALLTERFMAAATSGDLDGLLALLAPEATFTTDSGGKVAAWSLGATGAEKVAGLLIGFSRAVLNTPGVRVEAVTYNHTPALAIYRGEVQEAACLFESAGDRITSLYVIRNPDKLAALAVPRTVTRTDA